jgi:CubicO group peptidase (beta-lactamase class C family)
MNSWYVLVVVLIAFCVVANVSAAESSGKTELALEAIRAKYDFPGLAAIVVKDGKVCDLAAVGVRKTGDPAPLTTNDVFHIGSCTKSMTATVAAMFIEKGTLHWDTTISDVFPELVGRIDRKYEMVTLHQLLLHRGGVPGKPPAAAWKRAWEQQGTPTEQRYEFIKAVLKEPPEATPGTKYIYSNQGYSIAGAMLEKITGIAWEFLIAEHLFKPLHMASAGFGPPGTKEQVDQPWGHTRRGSELVALQEDNPPAIGPGGTVHCSLSELAAYAIIHLRGERIGGLLKPESFRKLHEPVDNGPEPYACGWVCCQRDWAGGKALTHNGSNTMWYLVMWLAPQKDLAVIVATNTGAGQTFQGCDEVAAQLIHKWTKPGREN